MNRILGGPGREPGVEMGKRIWNETGFYQGPSLERIDQKGFKDGEDVRFCLPVPLFIFEAGRFGILSTSSVPLVI